MGRMIRKSICIVMIMLMVVPSAWLAYAEDTVMENPDSTLLQDGQPQAGEVQDEPASQEPDAESVDPEAEPANSDTDPAMSETEPGTDSAEPADPEEEPAEPAADPAEPADTDDPEPEPTEPAISETEPTSSDESESPASEPEKNITIEGTILDGGSCGSGNGWSYDNTNNTIVLADFNDSADITTDGTGVTIVTSGLNRIGTLSCDGQIDVIGSGVLLVDNIELAEGCDFNLHSIREIYGEDGGSAAVFLRQEDGSYLLINGNITGLIDDKIILPEGITLVLPENSNLLVTALFCGITYDEEGDPIENYNVFHDPDTLWSPYYKPDKVYAFGGKLTVGNLVLKEGASITQVNKALIEGLEVVHSLVNDGTISGNLVNVKGDYSGSGVIEDAKIVVSKDQTMSITVKDSKLSLNGSYVIDNITSSGTSEVYYDQDTTIESIKMSAGDRLDIYGKGSFGYTNHKLKLTGYVDGGDIYFRSGIIDIEKQLKLLNEARLNYSNGSFLSGAAVFDYSGSDTVSLGINGPVFMGPDDVGTVPDQTAVPAVSLYLFEYTYLDNHFYLEEGDHKLIEPFDVTGMGTDGAITFEDLHNKFKESKYYKESDYYNNKPAAFEVFRLTDGKLTMTVLGENYEDSVPNDSIVLIRIITNHYGYHEPMGGSTATSTLSQRVGSGTIGGNANSILTGTGITRKDSAKPDTAEPAKPNTAEPAKPDPVEPAKPDPVEPAKPDTVEPAKPDPVEPAKPDTVEPAKPDPVEPAKPDPVDPAKPDPVEPEKPDPVEPVTPDQVEPEKPDLIETDDPVESDTEKPAGANWVKPVKVGTANREDLMLMIDLFDLNKDKDTDEEALYYVLSAYRNGKRINEFTAPVRVTMDYKLPGEFEETPLYVVFANENRDEDDPADEQLAAYRAEYDETNGQLYFETPQLGNFVIVPLEFEGEEYSPEFYDELEKAPEVQPLLKLLKEKPE